MGLAQLENKRKPLAHTRSESNKRRPCSNTLTLLPLIPLHLGLSLSVNSYSPSLAKRQKKNCRGSPVTHSLSGTHTQREMVRIIPMAASSIRPSLSTLRFAGASRLGLSLASFAPPRRLAFLHLGSGELPSLLNPKLAWFSCIHL